MVPAFWDSRSRNAGVYNGNEAESYGEVQDSSPFILQNLSLGHANSIPSWVSGGRPEIGSLARRKKNMAQKKTLARGSAG